MQTDDLLIRLVEDVAEIKRHLVEMNGTIADVAAEVGGAPDYKIRGQRPSMRDRLHEVESASEAVRLVADGLLAELRKLSGSVTGFEEERKAQHIAQAVLNEAAAKRRSVWTRRQKWSVYGFACVAAIEGLLRLLGVGG